MPNSPNLAEGHFARGLMLWTPYKRFPHAQAIQSYRRAIELDPNFDEAHHQLGFIYLHIGMLDIRIEAPKQRLQPPSRQPVSFRGSGIASRLYLRRD